MSAFAPLVGAKCAAKSLVASPSLPPLTIRRRESRPEHVALLSVPSGRSRCLRGPCGRRQARDDFCFPLNHPRRLAGLRRQHGLNRCNRLLKLLVRQVLERIAVLDLVFARDKQGETSQVHPRLLAAHLCDGFFSVLTEIA